ncbi:MAG: CopD family protein [Myxococcales bacterium]|nr:CopD family protein [Myxococcales bacterium]
MVVYRFLHMIGMALWVGGAVAVALSAARLPPASAEAQRAAQGLRKASLLVATPGMVLAFIGGLGMLIPNWTTLYAKAGWMHGKLALVVVLAALTGVLSGKLRKTASGSAEVAPRTFRILGWVMALIAVVIIALAVFRP